MAGKGVKLDERSFVQQHRDPLAGGAFSAGVLFFNGRGTGGMLGCVTAL
jgi:hypothetical protein